VITFFVPGIPTPQGSMKAFNNPKGGRPIVTSDNLGLKGWRDAIRNAAERHTEGVPIIEEPVSVVVTFVLNRPVSLPKYIIWPGKKPDIDKLERALYDAITGVVFRDDALVVDVHVRKVYAQPGQQPGVRVAVEELANDRRVSTQGALV
jgi:crossover junction endodeoxyribonuclease RusA